MSFIYHMVPAKMDGDFLYPLSELRSLARTTFEREIKKYEDHPKRKDLPNRILKKLNCPQEEVIHFSPIHPHLMFAGLQSIFPGYSRSCLFYEVPIERVRGIPMLYFDMNATDTYIFGEDEPEEMFEIIRPENYKILRALPQEALEFYRQWKARGERGAPAMGRIPHIMVKGRVHIAGCRILDWKDAAESDIF